MSKFSADAEPVEQVNAAAVTAARRKNLLSIAMLLGVGPHRHLDIV
jgi:hypothetical protein